MESPNERTARPNAACAASNLKEGAGGAEGLAAAPDDLLVVAVLFFATDLLAPAACLVSIEADAFFV